METSSYYKPCYISADHHEFISRQFSLTSAFEEVSLRDIVCWRIENPTTSLGSLNLEFQVDLYSTIENEYPVRFLSEATTTQTHIDQNVFLCLYYHPS